MQSMQEVRPRPEPKRGTLSLKTCGAPGDIPGWNDLAASRSLYGSAEWLVFVDSHWPCDGSYIAAYLDDDLVGALPLHWGSGIGSPDAGQGEQCDLVLGGHKGNMGYLGLLPGAASRADVMDALLDAALSRCRDGGLRWSFENMDTGSALEIAAALSRTKTSRGRISLQNVDAYIDVTGRDIGEYVGALQTANRRTNFRRELSRFEESGCETRRLDLRRSAEIMGPLLANVQRKYGHSDAADEKVEIIRKQGQVLHAGSVVFGCFRGGECVAFSLFYRFGAALYFRTYGADYKTAGGEGIYNQLAFAEPLNLAFENGIDRIYLGTEALEAKARRGGRLRPLWSISETDAAENSVSTERLDAFRGRADFRSASALENEVRTLCNAISESSVT